MSLIYNLADKNDISSIRATNEKPTITTRGFFYSFFCKVAYTLGWLPLDNSIQPFANVIRDYTCHNRAECEGGVNYVLNKHFCNLCCRNACFVYEIIYEKIALYTK